MSYWQQHGFQAYCQTGERLGALHSLDHSEVFMELYREEEREEVDRGGQKDKRKEWKGERQILPVTSSLVVLHRLEHTEIHGIG